MFESKTITLRMPKLNLQIVILVLIVLLAAFQTFQLATLKNKASVVPAGAATQQTSGQAEGLQEMVGGC